MDPEFWHGRWRDNLIAFHKDRPNRALAEHFSALALGPGARVLVPLCGKSVDMRWLVKRGCQVLGVELSPIAVADFFREQAIDARESEAGRPVVVNFFATLVANGLAWQFQGHYGRTASDLISQGYLTPNGDVVRLPSDDTP